MRWADVENQVSPAPTENLNEAANAKAKLLPKPKAAETLPGLEIMQSRSGVFECPAHHVIYREVGRSKNAQVAYHNTAQQQSRHNCPNSRAVFRPEFPYAFGPSLQVFQHTGL